MTATPIAAVWLRDVLLDALNDAISRQQGKYASCRDCAVSPGGTGRVCADHDRAQGLIAEYQAAAVLVRMAGTDEDMAALLHGTEAPDG